MSAASPRPRPRSGARPISSCSTRPIRSRPRARPLDAALARIVRGRAVNPRFIEGMMRHGARGAAELAETVDRLVDFAETTGAVSSALFDLVHEAYLADPRVRDFLLRENPAAARAIAERLDAARRKGLWHPRRNDLDAGLAALRGGGGAMTAAVAPRRLPGPVGADGDRRRPARAARARRRRSRSMRSSGSARRRARTATASIEITRARQHPDPRARRRVSAPLFAAAVAALDIDIGEGVPVLADPLPGDPTALIDANALAAELRTRRSHRPRCALAPRCRWSSTAAARFISMRSRRHQAARRRQRRPDASCRARRRCRVGHRRSAPSRRRGAVDACCALLALIAAHGARGTRRAMCCGAAGSLRSSTPSASASRCVPLPPRPRAEPVGTHRSQDELYALGSGLPSAMPRPRRCAH